MKALLVLLSVAVLGLGAFGVAWSLSSSAAPIVAAPATDTLSPDIVAELQALRAETAALRGKIADLEMRQATLESRPAEAARRPAEGPETLAAVDALTLDEVRELVTAIQNPAAPGAKFEELVGNVIEAREEREREERLQKRREQTEQRISERVDELSETLGLTVNQSTEMKAILVDDRVQREELFNRMRDDGNFDRDQVRETMGQLRDATQKRLQGVLTPVQFEQYQELDDERNPWDRGRGGRGEGQNEGNNSSGGEERRGSRA